jgi:hypothetical protein
VNARLLVLLCAAFPVSADTNFAGYMKSFAVAQDEISAGPFNIDRTYQSQSALRLMWERFGSKAVWQLHYELSPVLVSRQLALTSPTFAQVDDSYRLTDIDSSLSDSDEKHQVYQNLDRFNVQFQFSHGDLTIGRQAITFGSARIINPTDVFLPFDVRTFNTEYRVGVDAIRYQSPMGELGELDVGVILGDNADSDNSAMFLQMRGNVAGKDLQLAVSRFARQNMIGAGVQTSLGDFGFWTELAAVSGDKDYLRTSLGVDYAFTSTTFMQIEYHYNGAGSKEPNDYLTTAMTTPYQRGGVFLLGRHYLIPALSIQASPLWSVGIQGIFNVDDQSAFLSASAVYNVAEDFYMDFGYYHFTGDSLSSSLTQPVQINSEYGASPNVLYASLRFYF